MASYGNMRDAYSSIYEKCDKKKSDKNKTTIVKEAIDTLLEAGMIDDKEYKSLMERQETDLEKMTRQLKVSNKPRAIPPNAPRKPLGDKKVPGMMDHSKRND